MVASNENNVLTDFFNTGVYDSKRPFKVTNAPAMDILVSSNLERLLYFASDRDASEVQSYMTALADEGQYKLSERTRRNLKQFKSCFATQNQVSDTILSVFAQTNYLIDPHTAVGRYAYQLVSDQKTPSLLAATASPYKFPQTILSALGDEPIEGAEALTRLSSKTNTDIPSQVLTLFDKPILHQKVITPNDILKSLKTELFDK